MVARGESTVIPAPEASAIEWLSSKSRRSAAGRKEFQVSAMSAGADDSRREFLKRAVLASAAGAAFPAIIPNHVFGKPGKPGANDRIQVGVIGVGFRANLLIDQLPKPGADRRAIGLLSDARRRGRGQAQEEVGRLPGLPPFARPQGHRRGDRGDGRFRPRDPVDPRLPGRQGRVRREAARRCIRARAGCW